MHVLNQNFDQHSIDIGTVVEASGAWTFSLLDTSPSVGAKCQAEEPPGMPRTSSLHSLTLGWHCAPSSPQPQPLSDDPVIMDNS